MRNDLTNSEVENKKLMNTINLLEKNMGKDIIIQLMKGQRKLKNTNK